MKLRKTRIKKTTKATGAVQYTAEYKWGFWWYQFDDSFSPDSYARSSYYEWAERQINGLDKFEFSDKGAKELIDLYLRYIQRKGARKMENKVVKVEYEDYP